MRSRRSSGVSTRDAARRQPDERVAIAPGTALRVLVAEDNPVNRKLVTTLLQKRGHHVTPSRTAATPSPR